MNKVSEPPDLKVITHDHLAGAIRLIKGYAGNGITFRIREGNKTGIDIFYPSAFVLLEQTDFYF